ncbi:MotA/TolQ/ExbB proton channel family protein [bacterium]|nr:MotA/TolQ/ExbB proton channel family protein [bacterium]
MTVLVKWFLVTALSGTAIFLAQTQGALSLIITNDKSYLGLSMMVLYALTTLFLGKMAFDMDVAKKDDSSELSSRAGIGWFIAEHFFTLGLLGTIIGLVIATSGAMGENLPVSQIVAGLKEGLNTAFFTTICGIVFSLLLQIQLLVLRYGKK